MDLKREFNILDALSTVQKVKKRKERLESCENYIKEMVENFEETLLKAYKDKGGLSKTSHIAIPEELGLSVAILSQSEHFPALIEKMKEQNISFLRADLHKRDILDVICGIDCIKSLNFNINEKTSYSDDDDKAKALFECRELVAAEKEKINCKFREASKLIIEEQDYFLNSKETVRQIDANCRLEIYREFIDPTKLEGFKELHEVARKIDKRVEVTYDLQVYLFDKDPYKDSTFASITDEKPAVKAKPSQNQPK